MITEKLISEITFIQGWTYNNKNVSNPFWIDNIKTEGLQLKQGKLISFWVKDGEKVFGQPPSEQVNTVIDEIYIKSHELPQIFQDKESNNPILKLGIVNNLPDIYCGKRIIIPSDIEELKKMSDFDRLMLFQKTDKSIIKSKSGRGGVQKYVEGNIMKLEANIAFLFDYSTKISGWEIDEHGVSCWGSVTTHINGKEITHSDVGIDIQEFRRDTKEPVFSVHEMMKNACTDMKKRCLACFGINGDVYRGEV